MKGGSQWPRFVDHHHFLGLPSLLLNVKQQRFFAPQCLRYSHRPVIDLARRLIALQVRIDSDEDSLCLWLLLAVLFFAYGGRCRPFFIFFHLFRLLLFGRLTNTIASHLSS